MILNKLMHVSVGKWLASLSQTRALMASTSVAR
jgi:hypothetical protein